MMADACWFLLLVVTCLCWLACVWRRRHDTRVHPRTATAVRERLLKPRTPLDCLACRAQPAAPPRATPTHAVVPPWREVKSRRGAPKRIATEGFACPQPTCAYYRITDAQVHALVGDGWHGKRERIQTFRCQACGVTFSARRDTPLYRLKTASQHVGVVLTALAEGLDVAAAARVFGYSERTIRTWVMRAGEHGERLHQRCFRQLHLLHVQFDELRTRLRSHRQVLWLWLVVDPVTKIIPVLHLGSRTQAAAHTVVHDLRQRLAPGCLPIVTSDGLNLYFYALTAHFGDWVASAGQKARQWQVAAGLIYGQVKKTYRRRKVVRISQVMRCGTRDQFRSALEALGLSGRLNTAFVERVNLTLRRGVAALARRTWATAQDAPQLLAQLEWWRTYYHFVRTHASLRVALSQRRERGGRRIAQRYRQRTPAMAASLTSRRWTVRELLLMPLPPAEAGSA